MLEDNAYPVTTRYEYNRLPETQKKSREESIRDTLEQVPVLKEVLKHFDEQIALLDSIDSVTADLSKDPQAHVNEMAANRMAKARLQIERSYILARVERAVR